MITETSLDLKLLKELLNSHSRAYEQSSALTSEYNIQFLEGEENAYSCMVITRDFKDLLIGSYNSSIMLWSIEENRCIRYYEGHYGGVLGMCLHREKETLFSSSLDLTVLKWDYKESIERSTVFESSEAINRVDITKDSLKLIGGTFTGNVIIINIEQNSAESIIKAHEKWISQLVLLKKSNEFISGSEDCSVKFWEIDGSTKMTISHKQPITCIEVSDDESKTAVGSHDSLITVISETTIQLPGHKKGITSLKFVKDSHIVSSSFDQTIKIWNIINRSLIKSLECFKVHSLISPKNPLILIAVGCTGGLLFLNTSSLEVESKYEFFNSLISEVRQAGDYIIVHDDKYISAFNLNTKKETIKYKAHHDSILHLKYSEKYGIIITASIDLTIKSWDIKKKCLLGTMIYHKSPIENLEVLEEKIVSLSADSLCIWDICSYKLEIFRKFSRPHQIFPSAERKHLVLAKLPYVEWVDIIDLNKIQDVRRIEYEFEEAKSIKLRRGNKYLVLSDGFRMHVIKVR